METNKTDLISVVVAVYNAEQTVEKCINSLLSQTYNNYEIILVNDCSKDSSLEICRQYEQHNKKISVINNAKNAGVSATRNKGIDISKGKYICFVDSDDYVEKNYLERLYECYLKYNTLPICGFTYYDEFNHKKPVKYLWSGGSQTVSLGEAFKLNDELYLTALWNKLFDNDLVKRNEVKFDTDLSMGEDLKFTAEYLNKSEIMEVYVLAESLYNYTKLTGASLMSEFGMNGMTGAIESLNLIRSLAKRTNPDAEKEYLRKIVEVKDSYIYFITRNSKLSDREKIEKIREFKPEFTKSDLRKEKYNLLKEKIHDKIF